MSATPSFLDPVERERARSGDNYVNFYAEALEASKQVMLQSLEEPDFAKAMTRRYDAAERMLASDDAREGPLAFAQKRKPVWTGR